MRHSPRKCVYDGVWMGRLVVRHKRQSSVSECGQNADEISNYAPCSALLPNCVTARLPAMARIVFSL